MILKFFKFSKIFKKLLKIVSKKLKQEINSKFYIKAF